MSYVKWGIDYTNPNWAGTAQGGPAVRSESAYTFQQQGMDLPRITTEVCIDGVPVKKYQDMANDRKDLIRALRRLLSALDDMNAHGAAYDEAKHLLARMGENND